MTPLPALSPWLRELGSHPPLSREREREVAMLARDGDQGARDLLISSNLRYAYRFATHYNFHGCRFEDLVGAAHVGLVIAADRYDPSRGPRFISYAGYWMRLKIMQEMEEMRFVTRIPTWRHQRFIRDEHASIRCEPVADDHEHMRAMQAPVQLVHVTHDGDDRELPIASPRPDPLEELAGEDQRAFVRRLVATLRGRPRHVIVAVYGLDGEPPRTMRAVAEELGITHQAVWQIRRRALAGMRARARGAVDR